MDYYAKLDLIIIRQRNDEVTKISLRINGTINVINYRATVPVSVPCSAAVDSAHPLLT